MKLQNRISLIILIVFMGGFLVAGLSTANLELYNSKVESMRIAKLLFTTASAVRDYTSDLIEPLDIDDQKGQVFIPQTVPSYAAQQVFARLGKEYEQYRYKETALNPTNPNDLPTDWQVEVIQYFVSNPSVTEFMETRTTLNGETSFYFSQPIKITSQSCLECHSTPNLAPPSQLKTYGNRGFGWKINEIVGARFIEVPTSVPQQQAKRSITSYLLLIASILLLAYSSVLLIIKIWVTQPLDQLAKILEEITKKPYSNDPVRLPKTGIDSVGRVTDSIQRLIRSFNYANTTKNQE